MSKEERFEIFNEDGKWVIKDNEKLPHLLDLYKSCVRLNEFVDKLADLEKQLVTMEKALENAIVPKFKKGQEVWFIYDENDDYNYTILNKKVMAFTYNNYEGDLFEYAMSDDGTRDTIWYGYIEDRYVFATKEEAEARLKEMMKNG